MDNALTLSDLTTNPPKGAIVCPRCDGWVTMATWGPGPELTSDDCPRCDGNGWIINGDNNDQHSNIRRYSQTDNLV